MVFAVHVKNGISMSRVRDKCNVGLEPKYQTNYKGIDAQKDSKGKNTRARFEKNMCRIKGLCRGCNNFVPAKAKAVTGEHCSRKICNK